MQLSGLDLFMDLIAKSKYIVALTGAGISTNAGIADFRGPQGIYTRAEIPGEKMFSIEHFRYDPTIFYKHMADMVDGYVNSQPTKGHLFLKKLEDLGKLKTVITQNIDGLHQKAGNSYVLDVHGNFRTFTCTQCDETVPIDDKIIATMRKGEVPKCRKCKGVLKPDVVFYGEPVHGLEKALTEVQKADLMICLGTSLTVYPVAMLPSYIVDGAKLVIVNKGETPYDQKAKVVLDMDIDEVAEKLGLL